MFQLDMHEAAEQFLRRVTFAPVISLVYLTYRPGGIDLLCESLKYQAPKYELLVIDGYTGRPERGLAQDYLLKNNINLKYYGPPKIHSYPVRLHNFCAAMNTGALHANTNFVIFLHDYTWLPPGIISQWAISKEQYPDSLVVGIASERNADEPIEVGDISVWDQEYFVDCCKHIREETNLWVPEEFEIFHLGMPVDFIERCNGFDERADCYHVTFPLLSIKSQAKSHGFEVVVDRRLVIWMLNHRNWTKFSDKLWWANHLTPENPGDTPPWPAISPNPFSFSDLHSMYTEVQV